MLHTSAVQRKIMLLHDRLYELISAKAPIAGGRLRTTSKLNGTAKVNDLLLALPNGGEEVLASWAAIREYIKGRSARPGRKNGEYAGGQQTLDRLVLRLFIDGPWAGRSDPLSSAAISVFAFGAGLGMSRGRVRYVIDRQYAANFPMFRTLARTRSKALSFSNAHTGVYTLYRHDANPEAGAQGYGAGLVIKATVSVRYPVPYKSFAGAGGGSQRVRCKMNLPGYGSERQSLYKYDGVVGHSGKKGAGWWTWLFQGRFGEQRRETEDLLLMYTRGFSADSPGVTTGTMMTQSQDSEHTPLVASVVLVRGEPVELLEEQDAAGRTYYRTEPDEASFMSRHAIIDLSKPGSWSADDRLALPHFLTANRDAYRAGLHV